MVTHAASKKRQRPDFTDQRRGFLDRGGQKLLACLGVSDCRIAHGAIGRHFGPPAHQHRTAPPTGQIEVEKLAVRVVQVLGGRFFDMHASGMQMHVHRGLELAGVGDPADSGFADLVDPRRHQVPVRGRNADDPGLDHRLAGRQIEAGMVRAMRIQQQDTAEPVVGQRFCDVGDKGDQCFGLDPDNPRKILVMFIEAIGHGWHHEHLVRGGKRHTFGDRHAQNRIGIQRHVRAVIFGGRNVEDDHTILVGIAHLFPRQMSISCCHGKTLARGVYLPSGHVPAGNTRQAGMISECRRQPIPWQSQGRCHQPSCHPAPFAWLRPDPGCLRGLQCQRR